MTTINVAATTPINHPLSSPTLTHAQVWAGLARKIHHPCEFVPVITGCTLLREDEHGGGVVTFTRRVTFQGGRQVIETCTMYPPNRVRFVADDDGSEVQNVISLGLHGELYMTHAFSWKREGVVPGGEAFREEEAMNQNMAIAAVSKSVEAMRQMVSDGRIEHCI
ncbi:hypothetical protein QQS21_003768 [Conoideocrella luteorostrata]|uniref:DUF1857-domain-containing protein n=1 Tax=Conoideocrella luteorostrata TaxID=1105319 RepID=A0AAJ0CV51_9HYPO|nr:hypothetical protein QQS21_003768 [Conoideocrella luteorostrata]